MNLDELVQLRRDLHRYAEPAFLEIRTSSIVAARLRDLAVPMRRGKDAMRVEEVAAYPDDATRARMLARAVATGADPTLADFAATEGTAIIAELDGNRPGPTWGIRCDMDALPLTEAADERHAPGALGFSCADGFMHACAHDTHTVIGLALAERLTDRDFPGRVRIFFQPAEEGGRGAASMIAAGAAEGVDRFVAVHLGLNQPAGTVFGGCEGLLATHKLRATFSGVASHAAGAPEAGRNALVGAATALLNVMAPPRCTPSTSTSSARAGRPPWTATPPSWTPWWRSPRRSTATTGRIACTRWAGATTPACSPARCSVRAASRRTCSSAAATRHRITTRTSTSTRRPFRSRSTCWTS
nr:amidohydrolase [Actinopolymorpha alba]